MAVVSLSRNEWARTIAPGQRLEKRINRITPRFPSIAYLGDNYRLREAGFCHINMSEKQKASTTYGTVDRSLLEGHGGSESLLGKIWDVETTEKSRNMSKLDGIKF